MLFMAIYNKRFVMRPDKNDKSPLLDKVSGFLEEKLGKGRFPLRYAVTGIKDGFMVIEVTILDETRS
jgi:hypothetical protein